MTNSNPAAASAVAQSNGRAPAAAPVAELIGLNKFYARGGEKIHALRDVSLAISPGEFLCVSGPSGAGKTTLLNILGAMDTPSSGEVRIAGRTVAARGKVLLSEAQRDKLRRGNIGFIFTEFFLMPTLTALQNVQMPLIWSGRADRGQARELLERVGLGHRLNHRPSELSGGEMQRVAIARALINAPLLLLADEPTGNVDTATRDNILSLFRELNDGGLTIVLASHDREIARGVSRVLHLRDGTASLTGEVR